ncbi:MAG: sugar ABC transporter ATP-binding protein [Bacillota bacterium]|nr:sugar ABC transporter ATP-binding protein [Bacillota bacterium]
MSEYLLEMQGISKVFPGVQALSKVDFQLRAGEIHALLGENGAGKSTLIKVLGGIYRPEEGEIRINGQQVSITDVNSARANGISIIHQELVLVPHMTVAENIFLGQEPTTRFGVNHGKMARDAQRMLDRFELGIEAESRVVDLSIAQQQMVEIVKAISFNCRILVMDEPTSSISDREVAALFEIMRNLAARGVGIIYISHKMSELYEVCDRVTVLRDGLFIGTREVVPGNRDELISMMVGRELSKYYVRDYCESQEVVLRCEKLDDGNRKHKRVHEVSFEVRRGEIVGFAGLVGAGRSEAMQCLFGITPGSTGDVYIEGKKVRIRNAVDAMGYGIAMVPENRKLQALYHVQNVRFNSTIEVLEKFINKLRVDHQLEASITQESIDKMRTKTPSQEQVISNLSGGNQQKVVIGRWLATTPKVLIMDEPTRGVDVGAKAEIYEIMNNLTKQGVSIIMISSELPEIINMSDRVYVMCEGRITGCIPHQELSQERIMHLATLEMTGGQAV